MTHRTGPGLSDVRPLQWMRVEQFPIDGPGERPTTRTPVEPLPPDPPDPTIELPQTPEVRRTSVVLIVASEYRVESPALLRDRIVSVALTPRRRPFEAPAQSLPHGPNMDREVPPPAPPTDMGKPEKVKGPRLRPRPRFPLRQRVAPKLQQPCLLGVERQPILLESLPQHCQHFLGILPILKTENEVVGVPDFTRLPAQPRLHHVLEPLVEHVVQVDVGQQRADHLPLAHPRLRDQQPSVLQYPDVDPLPDQPENAPVAHPLLDQLHELLPH